MRCYNCSSTDHHVFKAGELHNESPIHVCKGCGSVFHYVETTADGEAKMREYYRNEYRPAPTHANIITTTNKLNYLRLSLFPVIKKLSDEKKRPLVIGDIGCATGYLPAQLRRMGHRATGCELTKTYRRFSEHFYGTPIPENLEPKHKYDVLVLYHVLEHLPEPDVKLKEYVDMMADDGRFFISVPEWFDVLEEASGQDMQSFDNLFHKNHINLFSAQSVKNLFAKCGLVIESEDHLQYGQTYVLRKSPAVMEPGSIQGIPNTTITVKSESWEERVAQLKATKAAIEAYRAKDYRKALDLWPKFPEAHLAVILQQNGKEPQVQAEMFEAIKPILGDNFRIMRNLGVWLYQNQNYEGAIQVFDAILKIRPGADVWVWKGWSFREMGPRFYPQAMRCFNEAHTLDPRKWTEMINNICALAVKMPAWDEVAAEQAKEAIYAASGRQPLLVDPVLDPELAQAVTEKRQAQEVK